MCQKYWKEFLLKEGIVMNKLLKTTGVFILGVGLLTGCSHTSSQKSDNGNESSKVAIAHVDETKMIIEIM